MDAAAEITARTFGAPHTDPSAPARPSPLLPAPGRGPAWPPRAHLLAEPLAQGWGGAPSLSLPRTPPPASPGSSILLTTGKAETGCPETLHSGASEARLRPGSAQRARRVGGGDGAGATRALSRVSFPAAGIRPTMRTIRKTPRMQGAWTTSSQIGSPDLPPKVQTFAGTVHLQAGRHTPPSKRACQARRARRRASFCSIPPCA
ncbi:translation initiation factor IF-2-like isoform X1 [Cervus canadensis]|uniref:translation initiation factor IF-2-like isoform X1 n=1 Tax=Cervus canadensis TaxID=1574408 RepID=UPI001C9E8F81|nr:translation initiation factor IF-2-like isoform X1 [Cervus canadensis]